MTCESIVRSIIDLACGLKCYITFMARESSNGDLLVEYQAKTDKRIWQKKTHVIFCRPTPEPKGIHTLLAYGSSLSIVFDCFYFVMLCWNPQTLVCYICTVSLNVSVFVAYFRTHERQFKLLCY